jgi:hypothetical protein
LLLAGAFTAASVTYYAHSPWVGLGAAIIAGAMVAAILALACIRFKADQVVTGTGINILFIGLPAVLSGALFLSSGSTPQIPKENLLPELSKFVPGFLGQWRIFSDVSVISLLALIIVLGTAYVLYRTPFGLRLRAVGENPEAADTAGVSVYRLRYAGVLLSGVFAGIGGAWFEREHDAFGIDFGSGFGERLDRLDEAVGLIRRLLDGETVSHAGASYMMQEAVCEPRPVQDRLPVLIGGSGPQKTLRTTARFADLWNGYGSPDEIAATSEVLRARCDEIGRRFDDIERTVTVEVIVRDTVEAAEAAWNESDWLHGIYDQTESDGAGRGLSVGGPPDVVAAYLDGYRQIGVGEVIIVFRAPFDLETIGRLDEVRAALGG